MFRDRVVRLSCDAAMTMRARFTEVQPSARRWLLSAFLAFSIRRRASGERRERVSNSSPVRET